MIGTEDRVRIAAMARLRFDERRNAWLLLYPERGLSLSPTAADILNLCDGVRTVGDVTSALSLKYDRSRPEELEQDVLTFLQALAQKGLVERA